MKWAFKWHTSILPGRWSSTWKREEKKRKMCLGYVYDPCRHWIITLSSKFIFEQFVLMIKMKKLISAIPAGLKYETRNSCYRLQYRDIYFIVSKQIVTIFIFFIYSSVSILSRNPFFIKIVHWELCVVHIKLKKINGGVHHKLNIN